MKSMHRLAQGFVLAGLLLAGTPAARAASGNWNVNNAGNWSAAANWTPAAVPGTAAGDVVGLTYNITAARTVTIDTTSRTVGTLNIGDSGSTYYAYTLASSGTSVTLTFNNSGSGASLVQATTTAADVISAPLVLADNLTINNSSSGGLTISGVVSGSKNFTKIGSGTLTLSGTANTFTGKTSVGAGILRASSNISFGPVPGVYTADQITFNGGNLMNNSADLVIAANQGITLGAAGGGVQAGWTRAVTINSVITGPGGLNILPDATPGLISLNGVNTYTGPTKVGNSTTANTWCWLLVNGSLDPASAVTVITNGLLGGTGTVNGPVTVSTNGNVGPGGIGQAGTLTINNSVAISQAALVVDLASVTTEGAGVNDLLQVNGDLTLSGTITVTPTLINGQLAVGTYRLINYTGTLYASNATLVCANPQFGATFDLGTPGQVNLIIANGNPANLVWSGANSPVWDTTTTNWLNGGNAVAFNQGDAVTFDDTGTYIVPGSAYQLNQVGPLAAADTLLPAAVMVNTTNSFILSASGTAGRLGGSMALYKGGTGTLTMAHGNDNLPNLYTGPTVITNGVLKINNARALGPVTGGAIIATNGGTFDLNAQSMGVKPVVMRGAGFNGQGAVINSSGTGQNYALQAVTMAGDATVGTYGRFDLRGNPWDTFLSTGGQPYTLTKIGLNQFSLVGATIDPALGDIDVQQGILSFEANSTTMGDATRTLTVRANASLQFWGATNLMNKQFALNGGTAASIINGSGSNTMIGPITLNADSTFNVSGTSLALYGAVGGAGGLIKSGASPLYLYAANSYLGNTLISAGKLTLGPSAMLASSPVLSVASGATLDVSGVASGFSLASAQTLTGSGTVLGPLMAPAGAAISPGGSPGTLTVSNLLTLSGATATFELGASGTSATASDRIVAGSLAASGVTTLQIVPLGALDTLNPYTLITNLGPALPSGSETNFAVTSQSRYTFSVLPTDNSAGQAVQVQVGGGAPASLVWQGNDPANPTRWDTAVTSNWLNGAAADAFFAGDSVQFDDTAVGTTAALVGTVQPAFIHLANATKPITLAGAGALSTPSLSDDGGSLTTIANAAGNAFLNGVTNNSGTLVLANGGANNLGAGLLIGGGAVVISNAAGNAIGPVTINGGSLTVANNGANTLGAIALNSGTLDFTQPVDTTVGSVITGAGSLVKDGTNLLVLSGANTAFNGPVQVNAGMLRAGVATALGTTTAGTTIAPGATLDVNAQNLSNELVTVSGPGVGGLGALVNNSGTAQQNAFHNITLAGDTTFGGVGRWDLRTNNSGFAVLSTGGNAYNLTKVGANYVTLVSATVDPALGNIDVQQGGFGYEVWTSSLGDPTRTLNVYSNAYALMYGALNPLNKKVRLQAGALLLSQSASNTIWGTVELPGGLATIQTDVNLALTNQVSGPGSLLKNSTATLYLSASNNLTGSFILTNGNLSISHPNALGASGVVYVRRNATTGGSGPKLAMTGGITTPADMTADFTTAPAGGGDYRCSLGSDAGGANTWGGPIQLNGGDIVNFNAVTAAPLVINGATYGTNGFAGQAFYRGGGPVTLNGQITMPTGKFALTDNSVVTVNSTGNVWVSSQSAYGRLVVGADNALCPTAGMTIGQPGSAAYLDLNGHIQQIGSLATAGTATSQTIGSSSTNADSTLIFDGTTNSSAYGGYIVDSVASGTRKVALSVTSGRLELDAVNTYSGNTTIAGGTLALGAAGGISKTPIIDVQTGGTLEVSAMAALALASGQTLQGNGFVNGSITASSGATVAAGESVGTLTISNALTFTAGSTNVAEIDKVNATNDLVVASSLTYGGTLAVSLLNGSTLAPGDSFKLFNAASYSGAFDQIVPAIPGPGLGWKTDRLAIDGTLQVIAIAPAQIGGVSVLPDGNFRLSISGTVGGSYSVLASTNLSLPLTNWDALTNLTITTSPVLFDDLTATNYPQRFYLISAP